jgi:hypothetical protein
MAKEPIVSHETKVMDEAPAQAEPTAQAPEAEAEIEVVPVSPWQTNKDNPELGPEWDVADPTQIDQGHTK